jgi:hypothetical protein
MPLAGFEPTIPVFKRAKTFHPLDRAATVTGTTINYYYEGFEVFTAVVMKSIIFWDMTPCSP